MTRFFTVIASARLDRRSVLSHPRVGPQRLLTSCAYRLGKPHRTTRPLTPSVAGRGLRRALHARPSLPCGSLRDVNHPGIPVLPGAGLAIVGLAPRRTRYQDAFRWLDLRSRDRSRLARALFDVCLCLPRTLSPTANRPPSSPGDRRVKLTLAGSTDLSARVTPPGKMRLPNVCNRLTTRALSGSAGPRITASRRFRRGWQLPRGSPGRNLGGARDRVELRLTASFQLQRGFAIVPGFPGISAWSDL